MDDLISRQSVINVVNDVANCRPYKVVGKRETYSEYNEGWTDGLNRLEANINALPSAQPDLLEDGTLLLTVPQGMLENVKRVLVDEVGTKNCKVMYQDVPERKKGEWIHKPDIYLDEQTWECSECGEPWIFIEGTPSENNANFCPNCGADMK